MTWSPPTAGSFASGSFSTGCSVAYPTGISAGQILLVGMGTDNAGQSFTLSDAGFTLLASSTSDGSAALYGKVATGSESGSFTITGTAGGLGYAQCASFTGGLANMSTIVDASIAKGNSSSSVLSFSALTVPTSNDLIIGIAAGYAGGSVTGNLNNPTPFTAAIGQGHTTFDAFSWNYEIQTTATNISAGSWTPSGGTYSSATLIVALKQASSTGYTLGASNFPYALSVQGITLFPQLGNFTILPSALAYDLIVAPESSQYSIYPAANLYALTIENLGVTPVVLGPSFYTYTLFPASFSINGLNVMPTLVGLTYYEASFAIVNAGLVQTGPPSVTVQKGVDAGIVIGQFPPPGTSVTAGTEVMLTVTAGNNLLSVTFDLFQYQFGKFI